MQPAAGWTGPATFNIWSILESQALAAYHPSSRLQMAYVSTQSAGSRRQYGARGELRVGAEIVFRPGMIGRFNGCPTVRVPARDLDLLMLQDREVLLRVRGEAAIVRFLLHRGVDGALPPVLAQMGLTPPPTGPAAGPATGARPAEPGTPRWSGPARFDIRSTEASPSLAAYHSSVLLRTVPRPGTPEDKRNTTLRGKLEVGPEVVFRPAAMNRLDGYPTFRIPADRLDLLAVHDHELHLRVRGETAIVRFLLDRPDPALDAVVAGLGFPR